MSKGNTLKTVDFPASYVRIRGYVPSDAPKTTASKWHLFLFGGVHFSARWWFSGFLHLKKYARQIGSFP